MHVALYIPCYIDLFTPEVGVSVVRVLRRLGVDIDYAEGQTCCGQPAFNSGYVADARRVAEHFLAVFDRVPAEYIVCPSGSCAAMVAHYYPTLFAPGSEERARAVDVAGRVREFADFLVNVLGVEDVGARAQGRAVLHIGCHQRRELGVIEAPRRLLAHVSGLDVVEWANEELCCGFGGTFAVKMPDVSTAMADEKVRALEASGADMLVSCDSSCLLQLGGRLRRTGHTTRIVHLAQLLDSAVAPALPPRRSDT